MSARRSNILSLHGLGGAGPFTYALEKLLTLPGGPTQSPRTLLLLNKTGTPGGLNQSYMEQIIGHRFDSKALQVTVALFSIAALVPYLF